jgi:MHS family citrate/tricarballylate:H+ symporter-like MFS transporter
VSDRTQSKIRTVIRVSSGNFLEMYDFFVFGYYAAAIGHTFFPGNSEFATLMSSFMTFGVGFLMRRPWGRSCWAPISTSTAGAPVCC